MKVLNELTLELLDDLNVDLHEHVDVKRAAERASIDIKAIPEILWLTDPLERAGALVKEVMSHVTGEYKYNFDADGDMHSHSTSLLGYPGYVRVNMWRDENGKVEYRVVRDLVWERGTRVPDVSPGPLPVQAFLDKMEKWHDLGYSIGAIEPELSGSFALSQKAVDCWAGQLVMAQSRAQKRPRRGVQLEFDMLDCVGSTYIRARAYMKNK